MLVAFALLAPLILSAYWISALMTQMLILGICAASLIFLSAYGGMVSLAQLAIYGIAGFALGNLTTNGNTKGLNLGWAIGPGIVVAIAVAVLFAVIFGVLANRSYGIYFLMITLVFSVIANLVFGQVTSISGFGGISGIRAPGAINPDAHPSRLYLVTLVIALALLAMLRYVARTPFGLALQGIRDEPHRMRSLGYSVALHRTVAFALAGFVAAGGGILFVWWNGQISPSAIALPNTINILVIAVIGGLYRVEAAWLGALVFVVLNNYAESIAPASPAPAVPGARADRAPLPPAARAPRRARRQSRRRLGGLPTPQKAVPSATGTGMPIKIGVLSDCQGAFGTFDQQDLAGVDAAISQFAGGKPANPINPRAGWTGAAIGGHPLKLVGIGCSNDRESRLWEPPPC